MNFIKAKFEKESKIRMKWKIAESTLRQSGTFFKSDEFASNIPGVNYYLKINAFAGNHSKNPDVEIHFCLSMGNANKIDASYTIAVKSAVSTLRINHVYGATSTSSGQKLCTRGDIFNPQKKYFVNGFIEIELEGTLKPIGGIKRKAEKSLSLAEILWESEDGKDIFMVADKQEIKVHKWILSAKSPVFKAELESSFKEAKENKIEITDFCFKTIKTAVEFCYEQDITKSVDEENAFQLLHFADKYMMKAFHVLIQALLIEKLSESNVCKFANLSITSNANELRECCICFLVDLSKQSIIIDGIKSLKDEIITEVGRRSFFSSSA